ncbi:MAG: hypothetical protein ACTHZW_09040, partial [Microbacteriaceae bacterium]
APITVLQMRDHPAIHDDAPVNSVWSRKDDSASDETGSDETARSETETSTDEPADGEGEDRP